MAYVSKMHGIFGLFLILVLILVVSPRMVNNIYGTLLGRIILIGILIFFSMYNVTLGLLVALMLIIISEMAFREGLGNMDSTTIGDDNVTGSTSGSKIQVLSNAAAANGVTPGSGQIVQSIKDKAQQAQAQMPTGTDRQTIQDSIASVDSNSIPINKNMLQNSSTEPGPSPPALPNALEPSSSVRSALIHRPPATTVMNSM